MHTSYTNPPQTKHFLRYLLLFIFAAGFWLADGPRAQAATFAPSCTNGQGDVAALRTAVAMANSNGQADIDHAGDQLSVFAGARWRRYAHLWCRRRCADDPCWQWRHY